MTKDGVSKAAVQDLTADAKQQERDRFWAYVTVFGTLWGGLELTLGTFLHVLHVPKTGFIMVALSAILLMAQRRIFPVRWSTLAAGVVAACIKSLSPGGIIAGPIFGILSEALIIELCLMLSQKSVITSMWASFVSLLWSQLQSVFKMWIYYGNDFISSIVKVVEKFLKIQWTAALGWGLLGIAVLIVAVSGCACGLVGWQLGKKVSGRIEKLKQEAASPCEPHGAEDEGPDGEEKPENATDMAMHIMSRLSAGKKKRSQAIGEDVIKSRLYVLPVAVIALGLQFSGDLLFSGISLGIWVVMLAICARSVLKAIWWPKFWGITVVVSVICGAVLAWQFDKDSVGWQMDWMVGLEASARMIMRGVFVFSLVTWMTRCARPSEFLSVWEKVHLPGLGHALTRSYALLPEWLDRMNVLVKERPAGFMPTVRYVRESCYVCLVDAVMQTERMIKKS